MLDLQNDLCIYGHKYKLAGLRGETEQRMKLFFSFTSGNTESLHSDQVVHYAIK